MAHMVLRAKSCLRIFRSLQATARCLSGSATLCMRRPVLEVPEPPKRPPNAYVLFVKDNYGRTSGTASEIISELAKTWRNTPDADKQTYVDQCERLKKQHVIEMQEFLNSLGGEKKQKEYMEKIKVYRSEKKKYLKYFRMKRMGLIKPRALTPMNVYASAFLKESPYDEEDKGAIFRKLNENWAEMDDTEKEKYAEQAKKLNSTRLADYQARLKKAQREGVLPKTPAKKAKKKKVPKATKAKKKGKTLKSAAAAKKKSKSSSSSSKSSSTAQTASKQSTPSAQDRQYSSSAADTSDEGVDDDGSSWQPDVDMDDDEFVDLESKGAEFNDDEFVEGVDGDEERH